MKSSVAARLVALVVLLIANRGWGQAQYTNPDSSNSPGVVVEAATGVGPGNQAAPVSAANPLSMKCVIGCASAALPVIGGNTSLSVSSSSANVALPANTTTFPAVLLLNDGSSEVFYQLGNGGVTATTSTVPLPAGNQIVVSNNGATNIAAITSSGTSTLRVIQLSAPATIAGAGSGSGGGGGAVTIADGAAVNLGSLADAAWSGSGNGTLTSINKAIYARLGTPFQTGGSIGNTAFGISGTLPAFAATPTVKIDQTTPGVTNGVQATNLPSTVDTNTGNASASTPRVVLASNQPPVPVSPAAAATGGCTPITYVAAASTNATLVVAGAHTLEFVSVNGTNTTTQEFVKIFDKASAPTVGTDTPIGVWGVPGQTGGSGSNPSTIGPTGAALSNGLAFAMVQGIANSSTTAVAANDLSVTLCYK